MAYPGIYLYKRLVQAKLFIDNHFGEQIDLEQIADEACFSRFHFIRLFKSIYGKTPHQYLSKVRIDHAKLLLQQDVPVRDTCYEVGFDSITSFSAFFRKYTRLAPSVYQKQERQRRELIAVRPLAFVPACFAQQHGWKESNFQEVSSVRSPDLSGD